MARDDPQTNIRLPAELKNRLMEAAKSSNRTFGAEVVKRLSESFEWELLDPMRHPDHASQLIKQQAAIEALNERLNDITKLLSEGPGTKKRKGGMFK